MTFWENVASIPAYLFESANITSVTIGSNVESIGSSAFRGCSGLTEIIIPASVESVGSSAFYGCSGLTEITIPASVTSIGSSAFSGCSNLTEINYNAAAVADLTSSSNAFYNAGSNSDGITVIFGESVKSIPAYLFYTNSSSYAPNLVSVTIGSKVESIGSSAFYNCRNLTEINYNAVAVADLTNTSNVFYSAGSNSDGITVVFGESVTSIPARLFIYANITSVTIGSNVESIGSYVFSGCSNLTEINYNAAAVADLTSGSNVFYNVGSNSEGCTVTFGESVTSIPACLFRYANITSVAIGSNVESIGSSAFYGCSSLTEVTIGAGVTSIGSSAFSGCSNLTEINYNAAAVADLTNTSNVFANAGSDSDGIMVVFGESVISIPAYLFNTYSSSYAPNLVSVTIGSNVESIGSYAFEYCSNLTEITIPDSVKSIGSEAFRSCSGLTEVTIEEGVTSIGSSAFYNCSNLTEITIPDSVTSIGSQAFRNCSGLTEVTIGEGVTSIGSSAFSDCSSLTGVYISDLTAWCAISFGDSIANPLCYAGDLYLNGELVTELVIPEGVTSIGSYAFYGCSGLTKLTISEGVTSIGSHAFEDCSNLTEINYNAAAVADLPSGGSNIFSRAGSNSDGITVIFGESVKSIPAYLFCVHSKGTYVSTNIVSVMIGSNVESIGSSAFRGCSKLTEITIPASVTSIGSSAFEDCSNLAEINYNAAAVADLTSNSDVFYNAGSNSGGITVVFGESVTSIPARLFRYANITSVTIGSNVERIGSSAFDSCSNLTEITISDSVTSIGYQAFYNCYSLTKITIPDSVTSISSRAFYGCVKLMEVYNQSALNISAGITNNGYVAYYAKNVYTQEGGSWFTDTADGYRFFYDGSNGYLMGYYGAETALMLPASFTAYDGTEVSEYEIYTYALYGYSELTSVTIPDSVTSIGERAFYNCSSLTEITIPASVTSIGWGAFYNCSNLRSVTISEGVTSIGSSAFRGCSSLTEITIPASVTSIGLWAFYGCSNLTSVTFEITEGWWYASSSGATSGTEIASSDLADSSTAATYLKSTYYNYYWHRS